MANAFMMQFSSKCVLSSVCLSLFFFLQISSDKFKYCTFFFPFPATEWIGLSKRSWGVCVIQLFGAVGQCILAALVYGIRDWRLSQLIGASPFIITAIYIWYHVLMFVLCMFCVTLEVN